MAGRTKNEPVHTGCDAYFPHARRAISRVSVAGNNKHNPGEPLHWAVEKSTQHPDSAAGHMIDPYEIDPESGEMHIAAAAWRVMAWANTVYEAIELGLCTREDLLHGRVRVEQLGQRILDARNAKADASLQWAVLVGERKVEDPPLPVRSLEAEREQVGVHSGPPDARVLTEQTANAMADYAEMNAWLTASFTGKGLDVVVVDPISEPYYQPTRLSEEAIERWRSEELLRTGTMPTVIDADPLVEYQILTEKDMNYEYGPVYSEEVGANRLDHLNGVLYAPFDIIAGEEPEEGVELEVRIDLYPCENADCYLCDHQIRRYEVGL